MFAVQLFFHWMSLPQNVITVTTVFPYHIYRPHSITVKFPHPRGNYRGYRGIIAFPITVSSSARKQ